MNAANTNDSGQMADVISMWEARDFDDDGSGPPETAPGSTESAETDPDAPYGRKPSGEPYKVSQAVREQLARNRGQGGRGRSQAARKGTSSARASSSPRAKTTGPSRKSQILGAIQLAAAGLAAAGGMIPALAVDGLAVAVHAEPIAVALDELADQNNAVAVALDRIGKVGPYGALVMAVTPLVLQVAANHRLIPPVPNFGVHAPEDLVAMYQPGEAAGDQSGPLRPAG